MIDLQVIADKVNPGFLALRQAARSHDDAQHQCGVIRNRYANDPDPLSGELLEAAAHLEAVAKRKIIAIYREVVPVGVRQLVKATPGLSEYQIGRLLGEAGHPRLATSYKQVDNPDFDPEQPQSRTNEKRKAFPDELYLRSKSQWRQRCGYGSPGRHKAGETQEYALSRRLPKAKKIVWQMIGGQGGAAFQNGVADKNGRSRGLSPYNAIIQEVKAEYAEKLHTGPCSGGYVSAFGKVVFAKCKIGEDGRIVDKGQPKVRYAEAGDPFSPSHIQATAFRQAGRQLLEDIFDAAEEDWTQ